MESCFSSSIAKIEVCGGASSSDSLATVSSTVHVKVPMNWCTLKQDDLAEAFSPILLVIPDLNSLTCKTLPVVTFARQFCLHVHVLKNCHGI